MAVVERVSRYRWVILGLVFVAQLSNGLANQAIPPLAPVIQLELGLSKMEVGFLSSAALAGAWVALVAGGTLTDRVGVRKMLAIGQLGTAIFMLAMSMVGSFHQAVAMMFAAGMGGGAIMPAAGKAVMEWFSPRSRATVMGLKHTAGPLAGVLTAATLPVLAFQIGWRNAIAAVGLTMIVGAVATSVLYRDSRSREDPKERPAGMMAGLRSVGLNRNLWWVSLAAILFNNAQMSLTTYLALYLNEVALVPVVPEQPSRILAAGGFLALCQAGGVFGRVLWGVVSDRFFHGRRLVVLGLVGFLWVAMSLIMAWLEPGPQLWLLTGIVLVYGVIAVGWSPLYHVAITEMVGRQHSGTGLGFGMAVAQFGSVLGPPLFGFVVDRTGSYQMAWLLSASSCVAGTVTAFIAARGEKRLA